MLQALWLEACADLVSSGGQRCLLGKLSDIMGAQGLRLQQAMASYYAHCLYTTYLAALYRRLVARRGAKRAAVAHTLLVIVYRLLTQQQQGYQDPWDELLRRAGAAGG
jgi:hypothetical protein